MKKLTFLFLLAVIINTAVDAQVPPPIRRPGKLTKLEFCMNKENASVAGSGYFTSMLVSLNFGNVIICSTDIRSIKPAMVQNDKKTRVDLTYDIPLPAKPVYVSDLKADGKAGIKFKTNQSPYLKFMADFFIRMYFNDGTNELIAFQSLNMSADGTYKNITGIDKEIPVKSIIALREERKKLQDAVH